MNGVPATLGTTGNATVAESGVWPTGITLNPSTGAVTVAAGTVPGVYNVVYTLCDKLTPTTCATVSDEITVTGVSGPVTDAGTAPATGGTAIPNVAANDKVNGVPATLGTTGNATVAESGVWPTGITLNPSTGAVTVAAGTVPGVYNVVYTLCDKLTPSTCIIVINKITVLPVVVPVTESMSILSTGGIVFANIASNDTVNGVPATLGTTGNATVAELGTWPAGITLNPLTGAVTVTAGTPAGVYNVVYELCDKLTPITCNTVTSIITVGESPKIAIVKTASFDDNNGDGYAQAGETITYKFEISNIGNVPLTNVVVIDLLPGIVLRGGPIALGVGQTDTTSFEAKYSLTQADINKGNVENQAKVTAVSPIGTLVSDLSDNEMITDDKPTVLGISGCVIEVFNAVAPNGNGDNKVFRIRGLECYSDNTVEIYNRWGVLVFERAGYNNDDRAFRGVSEGRVTINQSEELPEGTYYYILRYKDSAATSFEKAGYLYINR